MPRITIELGALAPPLIRQLNEQGLYLPTEFPFEEYRQSLVRLRVAGFLTDSEYDAAAKRFIKRLSRVVTPLS